MGRRESLDLPAGKAPVNARGELRERLAARREEIEGAVLARVYAIASPEEGGDAEYLNGLRAAITAAIDYGLVAVEVGEERAGAIPMPMLVQAREAVRSRVGLDTVLRRYFAGYTAIGDFVMREARQPGWGIEPRALHDAQRELALLFDRIVAAISGEYVQAVAKAARRREERYAERVSRLLAGDPIATTEFGYDFEGWHLGIVAGLGVKGGLRELAAASGRRLLTAQAGEAMVWAWLGGRREFDAEQLASICALTEALPGTLALGEPASGMSGWRLTHRQAQAAWGVAQRRGGGMVRYAEVGLVTAILRDDVFAGFLTSAFLRPLAADRDGGETARRTLRAYFDADRNVSSTAAALGVTRQTVRARIQAIEERLERSVASCSVEIEAALRLGELDAPSR